MILMDSLLFSHTLLHSDSILSHHDIITPIVLLLYIYLVHNL